MLTVWGKRVIAPMHSHCHSGSYYWTRGKEMVLQTLSVLCSDVIPVGSWSQVPEHCCTKSLYKPGSYCRFQIGSYFGSVVCSVDVDKDSVTDVLLVGAPMFMNDLKKEEGRVYMFSITKVKTTL